ncbi:unnamed protein product [Schistosoma margrebowiei]|uniref:Uncharacterized protein n=1 Tax=Schistosoma margrebowiei TaxID=48269 RepID=A0AA85AH89_9TREM|nr:unnamed protein product [Schistosoma margrebowiei]
MSNEEVPFSKLNSSNLLLTTCQPTDLDDDMSDNRLLKLKILELSSELQRNMVYFNRRLGATEYELEQCQKTNEDLLSKQNLKIQSLQHENETYRNEISMLKINLEQYKQTNQLKQDKINQMEAYLAKLPTLEDYQEILNKFQFIKNQNVLLENHIKEYKIKLMNCDKQLIDVNNQVKQYEEREQLLQIQLDTIHNKRLNESETGRSNNMKSSNVIPIFVEDLKCELERYQIAFEKTKKLLEEERCRADTAETHQKMEQRKFNEFHERVEAEITGIKASLSTRRAEIRQLKKHISDITIEKQVLYENLYKVYNTLINIILLWKSINGQLCQHLYVYIQENVNEIIYLTKQLNNLSKGKKLNLIELLIQPKPLLNNINNNIVLYNEKQINNNNNLVMNTSLENSSSLLQIQSICNDDNKTNNCFTKNTWEASFDDVITTASQLSNNFNKEQLHNSLNQLIKTRTLLLKLRQELANKYADHLGGKIDCIVQ